MMVVCGKCGFNQPQDRYCANCGVDMLTFRPIQKPFLHRLMSHTFFQAFVVVTVVTTAFVIARYQRHQTLRNQAAISQAADQAAMKNSNRETSGNKEIASTSPASSAATNDATASQNEERTLSAADRAGTPALAAAGPAAPSAQAATQPAQTPSSDTPAAAQAPSEIRVHFAEVPRTALSAILADARNTSSYGAISSGVVMGAEARMEAAKAIRSWRELDTTELQSLKSGQIVIFRGSEVQGERLGLALRAVPLSSDESGAQLRIEIVRTMADLPTSPQVYDLKLPLADTFVIPKGGAAFVVGSLPRRRLSEAEQKLFANVAIFQVMKSENYFSAVSDFLIFIEAR